MIAVVGLESAQRLAELHALAFERPWAAGEFARLLSNPAAFALAEEGAGFILAWAVGGEAEVLTLAVAPDRRRQGLAASLVAAAAGVAAGRGAEAIYLEVAANNEAAGGLYAKLGFVEAGRRKGYYEGGADAVVMRRRLPLDGASVDSPRR